MMYAMLRFFGCCCDLLDEDFAWVDEDFAWVDDACDGDDVCCEEDALDADELRDADRRFLAILLPLHYDAGFPPWMIVNWRILPRLRSDSKFQRWWAAAYDFTTPAAAGSKSSDQ